MRRATAVALAFAAAAALPSVPGRAADDIGLREAPPLQLAQLQDPGETIYEPVEPTREDERINAGGVNFDLKVNYFTDYVFRGVDQSERLAAIPTDDDPALPVEEVGSEDAPNLQFDGMFKFDLGKFPSPFAGLFVNVFQDDPGSEFQEIRPYFGLEWEIRPLTISAGHNTFIYPERDEVETSEVWMSLELDDSRLWRTDDPVLSPYAFVAYDYDLYDGFYSELGVRHVFELEGTGVTLTAVAAVAYVTGHDFFEDPDAANPSDSGFQHYDIGLIGTYPLNGLLNIPRRYGRWTLNGHLFYTDNIEDELLADTQLWGGVQLRFEY